MWSCTRSVTLSLLLSHPYSLSFGFSASISFRSARMPVVIVQKAPISFQPYSLTLMHRHTQLVFLLFPIGNGFKVLVFVTYAALIFVRCCCCRRQHRFLLRPANLNYSPKHVLDRVNEQASLRFTCNFSKSKSLFFSADFLLFTVLLCALLSHFSGRLTHYVHPFRLYQKVNIIMHSKHINTWKSVRWRRERAKNEPRNTKNSIQAIINIKLLQLPFTFDSGSIEHDRSELSQRGMRITR